MASAMCFLFSFADYGAYEPDPREARAGQRLPLLARANMTAFSRQGNLVTCGLPQVCRALATKGFAVLFFAPCRKAASCLASYGSSNPIRAKRI